MREHAHEPMMEGEGCLTLTDDGTLGTVIRCTETGREFRFSEIDSDYRDPATGELYEEHFVGEMFEMGEFDDEIEDNHGKD